eukprot:CAMPEP_0119280938 /NCGR_PEP_ID=MMETSP1329-20130426/23697_1 /TAXON_ID=114041 /ORGANISM="Genus nov. species nov., Strain RCC1024" /LENGTH=112 /DNA_ID=CAMNT_0007281539 /DNA_START=70 /DNA_END=405 /DNA_ORIENTATION=-
MALKQHNARLASILARVARAAAPHKEPPSPQSPPPPDASSASSSRVASPELARGRYLPELSDGLEWAAIYCDVKTLGAVACTSRALAQFASSPNAGWALVQGAGGSLRAFGW